MLCLFIALSLGLTHCSSDDNGGGGGGGDTTPPPDPAQCELGAEEQGLSFASGVGTEDTPFEVSSAGELENIGQLLYCNFRLTQNITLSGNWTPIGTESPCDGGNDDACFQGTLDGNDFMISGLTVNITGDHGGLFGYTGEHAEIRSVGLSGVNIIAGGSTGGLVGRNGGSIGDSYVSGAVTSGGENIGGLAGNNNGNISNSYAAATVTSSTTGVSSDVGGLVGVNDGAGNISNSYVAATATVTSSTRNVGGLVGFNNGTIRNSYAAGAVSGNRKIGGLVGDNNNGTINNSYAVGAVTAMVVTAGGGAVGFDIRSIATATVSKVYWDEDTTGFATSACDSHSTCTDTAALSTTEMKDGSSAALGDGFQINAGSYPKVKKCTVCTGTLEFSDELVPGQ